MKKIISLSDGYYNFTELLDILDKDKPYLFFIDTWSSPSVRDLYLINSERGWKNLRIMTSIMSIKSYRSQEQDIKVAFYEMSPLRCVWEIRRLSGNASEMFVLAQLEPDSDIVALYNKYRKDSSHIAYIDFSRAAYRRIFSEMKTMLQVTLDSRAF